MSETEQCPRCGDLKFEHPEKGGYRSFDDCLRRPRPSTLEEGRAVSAAEVTVVGYGGGVLRLLACALGIHKDKEGPIPSDSGPRSIRYCISCGESDDARWSWAWTEHRGDLGEGIRLVKYREAGA